MIHVETSLDPRPIPASLLERAARAALAHQAAEGDLTIVLTDDARLRELNRAYLGIDAPTDVLSFPAAETDPDTGSKYLGDILISMPRAVEQAQAGGHPVESETQLLVVHGILHLLGFDHARPEEKRRMWAAQAQILQDLGLKGIRIPE